MRCIDFRFFDASKIARIAMAVEGGTAACGDAL